MIGIVIDKGQKDEIERIYRSWFNKYLKPFKETINKDEKLKKCLYACVPTLADISHLI